MKALTLSLLVAAITAFDSDTLPRRGALGVSLTPVSKSQASELKLGAGTGVVAMQPIAGLTAERTGMKSRVVANLLSNASRRVGLDTKRAGRTKPHRGE